MLARLSYRARNSIGEVQNGPISVADAQREMIYQSKLRHHLSGRLANAALLVLLAGWLAPGGQALVTSAKTSRRYLPEGGKLSPIDALADASASDALKKALEPKGFSVSLADGTELCRIWLRSGVAAGKNEAQGAAYTWLADSALVAVVTFPKSTTDYRRQPLKAGTYTLRYAVHPQDGNHIGISPIRDFLLLVPIADDQNPDA